MKEFRKFPRIFQTGNRYLTERYETNLCMKFKFGC